MTSQPLNRPVDVIGVLDAAGANPYAEQGSPAWELARLGKVVADLVEVSQALLAHRHGEYPRLGYLRDNDASRAQLDALATSLTRIEVRP